MRETWPRRCGRDNAIKSSLRMAGRSPAASARDSMQPCRLCLNRCLTILPP